MIVKNWSERVTLAQKRKRFTPDDKQRAGLWAYCAVGENPKIVRHNFGAGAPIETKAHDLGLEFLNAVKRGWFYKAEKLLKQIQRLKQ